MKLTFLRQSRIVRAPWYSRGARRAVIATALALAVLLVGVSVFALRPDEEPEGYRDPYQPEPVGSTLCGAFPAREPCLDLAGEIRYALLKAPDPTADTVILDLGGPGRAALSGQDNLAGLAADYPELSERFNLLVLEEPWVTSGVPPSADGQGSSCEDDAARFYRALRTAIDDLDTYGRAVASSCALAFPEFAATPDPAAGHQDWGFNPRDYPRYVERILARHALTLRGFVGHSWGSARFSYLHGMDLDFAILVRPFPVGIEAHRLVSARAAAIRDTLPGSIQAVEQTELDTRSLPVTYFDQLSAAVELGYVDDDYFAEHASGLLSGEEDAEVGSLSDQLWHRYQVESLSPAKLAQWQEICGTVRGPLPELDTDRIHTVRDLLAADFAPCASLRTREPPQMAAGESPTASERDPPERPSNCIVTSPFDTVTPQVLIRQQYSFILDAYVTWVESERRSHRSLDGLTECLTRVLPDR